MKQLSPLLLMVILLAGPLWGQGDFQKGISYYKQGQYAKAASEFEQLVVASPDYEAGFRVLGDCYLKLKDYEKAARSFRRAVELEVDNFVSHYGLAVAEFNLGQFENVVATLLRAERRARSPRERYQLYETRGSAYYKLKRFDEAVRDLSRANSIQRAEYRVVFKLGVAHLQLGNQDDALRFLQQAKALRPDSQEASQFLSRLKYYSAVEAITNRRYSEAIPALKDFLQENPEDGEAWFNLGLAHLFNQELNPAEEAFKRTAEILPETWEKAWEIYNRLGYIYEMTERYDDSLKSYRKALELHSDAAIRESVERIQERLRRQRS